MAKKKADMNVHDLSVKTAKFYEYNQNNSGGSFVVDKNLCHRLMIEADEQHLADRIAISLGVYFNGCYEGLDCDCCGEEKELQQIRTTIDEIEKSIEEIKEAVVKKE
jgi:hypothetical protein